MMIFLMLISSSIGSIVISNRRFNAGMSYLDNVWEGYIQWMPTDTLLPQPEI